jgi:hypothetical protein
MVEGMNMNTTKQQLRLAYALVLAARMALGRQQWELAESLRQAAGVLWPDYPDLVELQATVLYLTHQDGDALALLHGRTDTRSLVLAAACLIRLRDPSWRETLQEVLKRDDDDDDDEAALTLARRLWETNAGISAPEAETETEATSNNRLSDGFVYFQGVRA